MAGPLVSVLIPALNEERNILGAIGSVLDSFDSLAIPGEVIIIDDGSSDNTLYLVKELALKESRISVIAHEASCGIGTSFWDGVDKSKGEIVCMLPGDNENIPGEILRYLRFMDEVDIVIPFVCNKGDRSLARRLISNIYNVLVNLTFRTSFNYTNGTVLYRRSILKDIDHRSRGFFFQTDILVRLTKRGYLFAEVPYRIGVREAGRSKAFSFSSLLQLLKEYLALIRDIYFKRKIRSKESAFDKDSVSAERYKSHE